MKDTLERLVQGERLDFKEASALAHRLATDESVTPVQTGAILAILRTRRLEISELAGFRSALFALRVPVDLAGAAVVDLCGAGGDGKGSFNISTTAAFIAAGAGVLIAKHGNYGFSSLTGSSTVLEHLGASFTADSGRLQRILDCAGICYLHAPLFQPALARFAPVRRELGIRTIFNLLGPLLNPASPVAQVIGAPSREIYDIYSEYIQSGGIKALVVHTDDGFDEASLTDICRIHMSDGEQLLVPGSSASLPLIQTTDLLGGKTTADNAQIIIKVLSLTSTIEQQRVSVLNAALAIIARDGGWDLEAALAQAQASLDSGRALDTLRKFIESSRA